MHIPITRCVLGMIIELDKSSSIAKASCENFCNRLIRQNSRLVQLIAGLLGTIDKAINLPCFEAKLAFVCILVANYVDIIVNVVQEMSYLLDIVHHGLNSI